MKTCKRIFIGIIMMFSIMLLFAFSVGAKNYSGEVGENLDWSLDTETGKLEIYQSGPWKEGIDEGPWLKYSAYIKTVEIGDSVLYLDCAFEGCSKLENVSLGNSVTRIGSSVFKDCERLKSITIPNSVTEIGYEAFLGCTKLENVSLGNSVTIIGYNAFQDCKRLKSITFPNSVTEIGYRSFSGCTNLKNVTIGNGVTEIKSEAFADCVSLKSITIPNSVESFSNAFSGCTNLESIVIGNSVKSIDYGAFSQCRSLENIIIPDSVKSIGENAFSQCISLESVIVGKKVNTIKKGAFEGCTLLKNIIIPDSVKSIGENAFFQCISLESVTIGNSVTSIGASAFAICSNLKSVTIGNSVKTIGGGAFRECRKLISVEIPDSTTDIGDRAFTDCSSLKSAKIGKSVISIGYEVFENCTSLKSITIPNSIKTIPNYTFSNCTSLESVTLPKSLETIETDAFWGCSSLKSIKVDKNNKKYSSDAYGVLFNKNKTILMQYPAGNSRTSYTIPSSVTKIDPGAFDYCVNLSSIKVDNKNTKYSSDAYGVLFNKNKTKLIMYPTGNTRTSYIIPKSVTSIEHLAFHNCTRLKNVEIPNGVKTIGTHAFDGCSSLESLVIPSITSIDRPLASTLFRDCKNLKNIKVDKNNKNYSSDSYGVLFNKDKTVLFKYPARNSRTTYVVPNSVKTIDVSAFEYCTNLKSITIPDSVTEIGDFAFYCCNNLTSITVGKGADIPLHAFYDCKNLKSIKVDKNNKNYSSDAYGVLFNKNKTTLMQYPAGNSRTSYTIPSNVTKIESDALDYFVNLSSIKVDNKNTKYSSDAYGVLFNKNKTILIKYPSNNGSTSYTIPNSVTSIDNKAFYDCKNLKSLTIPDSITRIYGSRFVNCKNLKNIYYSGTEAQWINCFIDGDVDCFKSAVIHYGTGTHSYTSKTTKATYIADGVKTYTCTCGAKYTKAIPKLILGVPENLRTASDGTTINISWDKVTGATGYRIYYYDNGWKAVKTTTATSYTITGLTAGTNYRFAVKAYTKNGTTTIWAPKFSEIKTATAPVPPTTVKQTAGTDKTVTVKWDACDNATGYRVYKYNSSTKKWETVVKATTKLTAKISGLSANRQYYIAVKPYTKTESGYVWGTAFTKILVGTAPATPTVKLASTSKGRATIAWNNVLGEKGYQVYYSTSAASGFKKLSNYNADIVKA